MSTGVFVVLLAVAWFFAMKAGRQVAMSVLALAVGVVLAASGGPLASTATTLVAGARTILTTVGAAISG